MEVMDTEKMEISNSTLCITLNQTRTVLLYLSITVFVGASLFILTLLCLSQKQVRLWRSCCWRHFGLPVPMNFLITPRYRLPYILVFSVMANELFTQLGAAGSYTPNSIQHNPYLNVLYKILVVPLIVVGILGLKFFPLLGCVEAPHLFFGHCLGLLYSILWKADALARVVLLYYTDVCQQGTYLPAWRLAVFVLQQVPKLLIILSLIVWYIYNMTKTIVGALRGQGLNPAAVEIKQYHLARVKRLFSKALPVEVTRGRLVQLLLKVLRYFIPYSKYHKLPMQLLCVVAAMCMFLYQLSLPLAIGGFQLSKKLSDFYHEVKDAVNLSAAGDDLLSSLLVGVPVVFILAPFVSLFLCIFLLLHMLASISKLVKSYAKCGFKENLPAKLSRVPSAWTYLGSQFGFFVNAYLIYLLVSLLLGFALIVIIYGLKYFTSYIVNFAVITFIPLIWSRLLFYLQFLLCKFVFFEDSKGKFVSITNRRLFNWFAYLLFLYNGFAGFVGAIIRVAFSAVVTLLLLFRLDTVVMAKGFEFLDFGHRSFLGFFYLYYSYNSAVMHTFIYLLRKDVLPQHARSSPRDSLSSPLLSDSSTRFLEDVSGYQRSKQFYRNRWLVAYTLLRNPSLQPLTASNIARAKREELTTSLSVDAEEVDMVPGKEGVIVTFD